METDLLLVLCVFCVVFLATEGVHIDYQKLTVVKLKALLRDRSLPVSGVKSVLVQRLVFCEANNINKMNNKASSSSSSSKGGVSREIDREDVLKVLNYNVDGLRDEFNSAQRESHSRIRRHIVSDILLPSDADVICLQELTKLTCDDFINGLSPAYVSYLPPPTRAPNKQNYFTMAFVRSSVSDRRKVPRLQLLRQDRSNFHTPDAASFMERDKLYTNISFCGRIVLIATSHLESMGPSKDIRKAQLEEVLGELERGMKSHESQVQLTLQGGTPPREAFGPVGHDFGIFCGDMNIRVAEEIEVMKGGAYPTIRDGYADSGASQFKPLTEAQKKKKINNNHSIDSGGEVLPHTWARAMSSGFADAGQDRIAKARYDRFFYTKVMEACTQLNADNGDNGDNNDGSSPAAGAAGIGGDKIAAERYIAEICPALPANRATTGQDQPLPNGYQLFGHQDSHLVPSSLEWGYRTPSDHYAVLARFRVSPSTEFLNQPLPETKTQTAVAESSSSSSGSIFRFSGSDGSGGKGRKFPGSLSQSSTSPTFGASFGAISSMLFGSPSEGDGEGEGEKGRERESEDIEGDMEAQDLEKAIQMSLESAQGSPMSVATDYTSACTSVGVGMGAVKSPRRNRDRSESTHSQSDSPYRSTQRGPQGTSSTSAISLMSDSSDEDESGLRKRSKPAEEKEKEKEKEGGNKEELKKDGGSLEQRRRVQLEALNKRGM